MKVLYTLSFIYKGTCMKIELMTRWYNEEFLARFFLRHYRFVDKIHLFLDMDTNDTTREVIEQERKIYDNVKIHEFKFPESKVNDAIGNNQFNNFYKTMNCDYVILVDADEFIFYPPGYLESSPYSIHFTTLWTVYKHITDKDLNTELPVWIQRRHGTRDNDGYDMYTKVNIVKAGLPFEWRIGMHSGLLDEKYIDWWSLPHEMLPPEVCCVPLNGAHWCSADPTFVLKRRLDRSARQSNYNKANELSIQHWNVTEEKIVNLLKQHENDPQVF